MGHMDPCRAQFAILSRVERTYSAPSDSALQGSEHNSTSCSALSLGTEENGISIRTYCAKIPSNRSLPRVKLVEQRHRRQTVIRIAWRCPTLRTANGSSDVRPCQGTERELRAKRDLVFGYGCCTQACDRGWSEVTSTEAGGQQGQTARVLNGPVEVLCESGQLPACARRAIRVASSRLVRRHRGLAWEASERVCAARREEAGQGGPMHPRASRRDMAGLVAFEEGMCFAFDGSAMPTEVALTTAMGYVPCNGQLLTPKCRMVGTRVDRCFGSTARCAR